MKLYSQKETPFELYGGRKPSVRHLKPFGSIAYVGIPRQLRKNKFYPKAKKGVLVGYALATKGYRIWLPDENKVIETINVSFNEDATSYEKGREDSTSTEERNGEELGPIYELGRRNLDPFGGNQEGLTESTSPSPRHSDHSSDEDEEELRKGVWFREIKTRRVAAGGETEVYYYENEKKQKLRSLNDIEKFCLKKKIKFEPELFNFEESNKYEGIVQGQTESSRSNLNSEDEGTYLENNSTDS